MIGFDNEEGAKTAQSILRSTPVTTFIKSLLFTGAKRIVNKELLMRIDLTKASELMPTDELGDAEAQRYKNYCKTTQRPSGPHCFSHRGHE